MKEFERLLSHKGKKQLRVVHIFKNAAQVIYKDVQNNKFKLLCLTSFPTTTMVATLAFIALGVTAQSRDYRKQLIQSVKEPVPYKLYTDFLSANFEGYYDIDTKKLRNHMIAQGRCHLIQDVFTNVACFPNGWIKTKIQKNLKKRMTKGELTLV